MLSSIFILSNLKIFLESKNTGGICRQNMHLSIENARKWDIIIIINGEKLLRNFSPEFEKYQNLQETFEPKIGKS